MRNGMVWVAVVVWSLVACAAQGTKQARPETVIRWHFAGANQLKQLKDQQSLAKVLALPQTTQLRDAAVTRFSQQAAGRFTKDAPPEARRAVTERVRALLPDLLDNETHFQMVTAGAEADWALAMKLPDEQHAAWKNGLTELARAAGLNVSDGDSWKATHEKYLLSLKREKGWTVFEGGYTTTADREKLFTDLRSGLEKRPGKEVLTVDFDFPRLGELWKAERLAHAPRVKVKASPNRDGLRSDVELEYSRDLGIKPEKWNVPTSLIRDPLIGFTAMQGVGQTLAASFLVKSLGLKNTPNQLFTWALSETPFSTYFAANVGNPATVVSNLFQYFSRQQEGGLFLGQPQAVTNGHGFIVRGLPVVMPFLEPGTGRASEFLHGGFFPVASKQSQSAPAELFEQLNKRNLIYYEWEITEARLKHWRPLWQVAQMANPRRALLGNAVSDHWTEAVMPLLGNTITEGTLEGARKINIVRQSHIGFNALELVLLAHWIDTDDVREVTLNAPGKAPAAPASQAPPPQKTPASPDAKTGR